jgi:hypothetical protein
MRVLAKFHLAGRDLRLDLFRGLANWAIFLDHIPHELMSRNRDEPKFPLGSDLRWGHRNTVYDCRRILLDLVQAARSRAFDDLTNLWLVQKWHF